MAHQMNMSATQNMKGKIDPFRKSSKIAKEVFFDVDFEESQVHTVTSYTLSQNSDIVNTVNIFKNPKRSGMNESMRKMNEEVQDPFDVAFEESKEVSSQGSQNTPQIGMEKSDEISSQDTTFTFKKPKLFKNSNLHSDFPFDVDFEESGETFKNQETQHSMTLSSTQKTNDTHSEEEVGRPSLFQKSGGHINNDIEVNFEESCQTEIAGNTQNTENSQASDNNKENVEDTTVSFVKCNPFREAQLRLKKPFDVDFEESSNENKALSKSLSSPTTSGVLPFRKSSAVNRENDFDVNFNETDLGNDPDDMTEKSGRVMYCPSPIPGSQSLTSVPNGMNATKSDLNQSSFNDENLGQWMSEESDDFEIEKNATRDANTRRMSVPGDISPPPIIETEEDHTQQLHIKLKEIVSNARSAKSHIKSPASVRKKTSFPEKPKKPKIKRSSSEKPKLKKPASFATKRLYSHIIKKIRPRYGLDSVIRAEELIVYMCDVVKIATRRKAYQKKLINDLKMEMAKMGIIETTYQFYEFIREFLPYEFRLKSVPCIQPGTNIVFPPKDAINPFEKILK